MSRTGLAWDPAFLGHQTTSVHPERPERVAALAPALLAREVPGFVRVDADPQLGLPWLRRVHSDAYVEQVRTAHARGRRALDATWETRVSADTFEVAVRAVGAALTLVGQVARGTLDNGFAALRPPGHHAGSNATRGFCIFNNAAICARFAQSLFGLQRVLVVDWDVHPADGTAGIFWEDPDVHVLSVHQEGIFTSAVGRADQVGAGAGRGATLNVPVPPNSPPIEWLRAFEKALADAAERCRPDLVLVSCGFDAHVADPIGREMLAEADFAWMTRQVKQVAAHYAQGRLVSLLEGGYCPNVLRRCVVAHLEALLD